MVPMPGNDAIFVVYQINAHYNTYACDGTFREHWRVEYPISPVMMVPWFPTHYSIRFEMLKRKIMKPYNRIHDYRFDGTSWKADIKL